MSHLCTTPYNTRCKSFFYVLIMPAPIQVDMVVYLPLYQYKGEGWLGAVCTLWNPGFVFWWKCAKMGKSGWNWLLPNVLKGFLLAVEQKFQSIACVLDTLTTIFIKINKSIQTNQKVPKTQAILWNFCSTANKNPFNTLGKSQFHPLLPSLAHFHQKMKPGFHKVHTAPNQPSPL